MQILKETQDKVYQEVKALLQEFSGFSSEEDFINNLEKLKTFLKKFLN
jgi:heme oxygenase